MTDFGTRVLAVIAIVAVALFGAWIIGIIVRLIGRRIPWLTALSRRTRMPFRCVVATAAAVIGMHANAPRGGWHIAIHVATLLLIGATAWLITALLFVVEGSALPRLRTDVSDNRHARTVRTQLIIVRRVTAVVVAILGIATALLTFREARLIGTSLLASAGVAAAVAAFAANTLLGNVVAGLQIAFSGALRLDDVVVVEQQWGRVEEITLTYVVVHIWDDRRLILPTSYFTTQPFENWTHSTSALLGEVILDVDWAVDLQPLREQLRAAVAETSLWDGRVCVVQMVDAVAGHVTIRALVSAIDAPTLWDLRCLARENLVAWIRDQGAPPRVRTELHSESSELKVEHRLTGAVAGAGDRVFSGNMGARLRGASFTGPDSSEDDRPADPN
jgi:hypothetical protein